MTSQNNKRVAELEIENASARVQIGALHANSVLNQAALLERDKELLAMAEQQERLLEKIEGLINDEPEVRAWADTDIPASVIDVLRK